MRSLAAPVIVENYPLSESRLTWRRCLGWGPRYILTGDRPVISRSRALTANLGGADTSMVLP